MSLKTILTGATILTAGIAAAAQLTKTTTAKSKATIQVVAAPTAKTSSTTAKAGAVATPAATSTASGASATSAGVTAAPAAPTLKALPPLDLSDMWLWHWDGKWMASEWDNGNSPFPWRYNHVNQVGGKDTLFTLDKDGAPELPALNGTPAQTKGLWESDVTLPKLRDGLIVAPLWLYDGNSRDEVDFELAGRRGLDVTMHAYVNGVHQQNTVRLFEGQDLSGQRKRLGIKVDEAAGYVEMYVDGVMMQRWDRSKMSFFISNPVKPVIEMWAASPSNAGFVYWAGQWTGLATNETLTMTVHGYNYTTLP